MYGYFVIKFLRARRRQRFLCFNRQSIPVIPSKIDFNSSLSFDVTETLENAGVNYRSGRHSAYVCGAVEQTKISDELSKRYSAPFGLKIIKSREISPDGTPYYTSAVLAPASTPWSMRAIGSVLEKSIVANLLHEVHVAPRVYDLIRLESKNGAFHYALVVQHIEGFVVHGSMGGEFIEKFKKVLKVRGMSTASIAEHCDLRAPLFRDNIVSDGDQIYYVDIQNFILSDIGKIDALKDQVVEKFRNDPLSVFTINSILGVKCEQAACIDGLISKIAGMISKSGYSLSDCVVVDICQGAGIMAIGLLSRDLFWSYLLRSDEECQLLQSWWNVCGYTRFDCRKSDSNSLGSLQLGQAPLSRSMGLICDGESPSFNQALQQQELRFVVVLCEGESCFQAGERLEKEGFGVAGREVVVVGDMKLKAAVYTRNSVSGL